MTIINIKFHALQSLGRRRPSKYYDKIIEYINGKISLVNKRSEKSNG